MTRVCVCVCVRESVSVYVCVCVCVCVSVSLEQTDGSNFNQAVEVLRLDDITNIISHCFSALCKGKIVGIVH